MDAQVKEFEKKLSESNETVKSLNSRIASVVAEKVQMRKSSEQMEKKYQSIISELRTQSAPLERRFQEVTRALVHAKEMETAAVKESHVQAELAKEVWNYFISGFKYLDVFCITLCCLKMNVLV